MIFIYFFLLVNSAVVFEVGKKNVSSEEKSCTQISVLARQECEPEKIHHQTLVNYIPILCAVGIKPGMIQIAPGPSIPVVLYKFVDVRHLILAPVHVGKLELRQLQFKEHHHLQYGTGRLAYGMIPISL